MVHNRNIIYVIDLVTDLEVARPLEEARSFVTLRHWYF